jgi:hypothetical protein
MKNLLLLFIFFCLSYSLHAQTRVSKLPDSAANIIYTGSGPGNHVWNINYPLNTTPPNIVAINTKSDYLYFYNYKFNIPSGATINGIILQFIGGGCNSGDYVLDSISLAYNGATIGTFKRDSLSTLGLDSIGRGPNDSCSDLWGATLTPAIINSPSFGIIHHIKAVGTCTYSIHASSLVICYTGGTTSVYNTELVQKTSIYPNPAYDKLIIENAGKGIYIISDLLGKRVLQGTTIDGKTEVDISVLQKGLYIIKTDKLVSRFVKE